MCSFQPKKWLTALPVGTATVLAVLTCFLATGFASSPKEQPADSIQKKWGIEVSGIRMTAADLMLDFRYRVKDPEKAVPILKRGQDVYLIEQASGEKLQVPTTKVGPMRATTVAPKADRQYTVLFSNLNKTVKRGSRVTVVIGDFRVENLVVK